MKILISLTLFLLFLSVKSCTAQDSSGFNISNKAISQINTKVSRIQTQLNRKSEKALRKWLVQEKRIRDKLYNSDSVAANLMFANPIDSMKQLSKLMNEKLYGSISRIDYNSYLDTLNTTFSFLKNNYSKAKGVSNQIETVNYGSDNIHQLIGKIEYSEKIKNYIQARKKFLLDRLGAKVAFAENLKQLKQQAYYYSEQVKGILEALKDKRKAEAKAIEMIGNVPAYQDFLEKNSQLASLFNFGNDAASAESIAGLQTRSQVETLLQNRVSGGGPNAAGVLGQQMDAARSKMDELKNKFSTLNNADEMPDFNPNESKAICSKARIRQQCPVSAQ
ncbi:hypothetical protein [Chitinophaga sp. W2I13]|uniref:hypothetical protein n=1 Tax=Chitinophaga sp. W2I13 TaxID=3373923 RepID=UPI003D1EAD09